MEDAICYFEFERSIQKVRVLLWLTQARLASFRRAFYRYPETAWTEF
jgi:metal-dependent amidase/aminoacylase/carboxypeptidase family protein